MVPQALFVAWETIPLLDVVSNSRNRMEQLFIILFISWLFVALVAVMIISVWYLKNAFQARPLILQKSILRCILMALSFPIGYLLRSVVEFKER